MQDDLTRAEHYGTLATAMRQTAEREADEKRRAELLGIASQYEFLADSLLCKTSNFP
jgi:pyruvate-formate lyase